jgi:peroxiredoxin
VKNLNPKIKQSYMNPCVWLGLFALFLSSTVYSSEIDTQIGKKVPAWELIDLNGKPVQSEKYKGKVIILNFWATWCPPCRAEMPDFMKLHAAYKDKGVTFLGISLDQGLGPVKRYVRTEKVNYPILMGNSKMVADYGNFSAIPQTFVIDAEGRINKQFMGLVKFEKLEKVIQSLIDAPRELGDSETSNEAAE